MKQNFSYDSKENHRLIDEFDYLGPAASSMECTGLIPRIPADENERKSYDDIYRYRSPAIHYKASSEKTD